MLAYIRAFLEYKPAKFETTLDRWERKGLVKPIKLPTSVRRFRQEDVERLPHDMWDDVAKEPLRDEVAKEPQDARGATNLQEGSWDGLADWLMAQLERASAARGSVRRTRKPNRWRLRRLYRWQQRHPDPGPRETYDSLLESLKQEGATG